MNNAPPASPPAADPQEDAPDAPEAQAARRFRRRGILFVVSAPSGAGKSTLLGSLRPGADFLYSVSCTTRRARPTEIDGKHYHFLEREEFERRLADGMFLEHAYVHGNYYGTPKDLVLQKLEAGVDMLLDIDIQGAAQVRQEPLVADSVVDIFIMPPSLPELRRRLIRRATETSAQIETRLENAARELENWRDYRYTIISGSIEDDVQRFRAIMLAERQRTNRIIISE